MILLKRWLPWLLVAALLAGGWQVWGLYQRQQQMWRWQLETLANHASQVGDAARALATDPHNEYERYRAGFNAQSFNLMSSRFYHSPIGGSCSSRGICEAMFWKDAVDPALMPLYSDRFFEAERLLRFLSNERFITQAKQDQVFAQLEIFMKELWDARR